MMPHDGMYVKIYYVTWLSDKYGIIRTFWHCEKKTKMDKFEVGQTCAEDIKVIVWAS